jgi:hypothetical protein
LVVFFAMIILLFCRGATFGGISDDVNRSLATRDTTP